MALPDTLEETINLSCVFHCKTPFLNQPIQVQSPGCQRIVRLVFFAVEIAAAGDVQAVLLRQAQIFRRLRLRVDGVIALDGVQAIALEAQYQFVQRLAVQHNLIRVRQGNLAARRLEASTISVITSTVLRRT